MLFNDENLLKDYFQLSLQPLFYIISNFLLKMKDLDFPQLPQLDQISKESNQPSNSISMKSSERIKNNYHNEACLLDFEDIISQNLQDSQPHSSVKRESIEDDQHNIGEGWTLNYDPVFPSSLQKIRYFCQLDNSNEEILGTRFDLDHTLTQATAEIQKKSTSVMSYMKKIKKATNLLKKLTEAIAKQTNNQLYQKKYRHIKKMMKQKKFNIKQFKKLVSRSNILSEGQAFTSRKHLNKIIRKQLAMNICHGKTLDKIDNLVQTKVYGLRLRSEELALRQTFR